MKQKCLACGAEKDISIKEVYPYPDDGVIVHKPIGPLFSIDCQPGASDGWRIVTVCHECFHKLDVDMWIDEKCWLALNPITPFERLPKLDRK